MSPLDKKLFRDLRRMKGQVTAIVLVIATGVMLQVMMSGLVSSLTETRRAYYERNRLADVISTATRVPNSVLSSIAGIPNVRAASGRITGSALIHLEQVSVPVQARIISLPDQGEQALNKVHLVEGRLPAPRHRDEALLLSGFARAHGIEPGDTVEVTMNGSRRMLKIAGLADSPDLLFVAAPGELVPDPARYAGFWLRQTALAAIYDMEGAFNEVLVAHDRDATAQAIIDAMDRILAPWGGTGAFERSELVSDRYVSEEIEGLAVMSRAVPPLFLAVAAFLLYIVVSRMVQAEREEIGLLKAFGYTGGEIAGHYLKLVVIVAVAGAALGSVLGFLAGRAMVPIYTTFYNFPFLVFRPDPAAFGVGLVFSIAGASAGSIFVLNRIFALTPSEAMRPPAPADYSRSVTFKSWLGSLLDQPTRMVLRGVVRSPWRIAALAAGIAGGMALAAGMTTVYGAFDRMMALNFTVIDRSDATVVFNGDVSRKAVFELARIPGVIAVEPLREVAAVFRHGRESHRGSISGLTAEPVMARAIDADLNEIPLPEKGMILGEALADILGVVPGDVLTVEVREGRQPVLEVPVAGVAQSLIGAPAYMRLESLNDRLREPGRISGARLRLDAARSDEIYRTIKDLPTVAAVIVADHAQASLEKLMDQGAGSARYIMGAVAFIISFGIVYNAARIAYNERARDLASLRVMGFSNSETGFVLLGEMAIITLIGIPLGSVGGYFLGAAIAIGFSSELYQIPHDFDAFSHGFAACFVLGAAVFSSLLVRRDLGRIDFVEVLKSRD